MTLMLLLALLLAVQGIPVLPNRGGTVTGVLKDSSGKPAPGVRVGAITQPDSPGDLSSASAMASISQTDEAGRYRLENVPPGRYYIAAGRVDFPTYYPGTLALASGKIVAITPGAVVDGIDFSMQDSSVRVAFSEALGSVLTFSLNAQASVEGSGRIPVFSPNGFVLIRLTNANDGSRTDAPITASTIAVSGPTAEYRVNIENLPPGFGVKAIMAGATNVTSGILKLSTLSFTTSPAPGQPTGPTTASTNLSVTLTRPASAPEAVPGVRVSGQVKNTGRRSIYLSGKPGMFYSDGTFEFRGVPPGLHTIATVESPGSMNRFGASLVVGDRDIEGVQLQEIALLPVDIQTEAQAGANVPRNAGTTVPLRSLQVAVMEAGSRAPAGPGTVYVTGPFGTSFDLPPDGRFEFSRLLPGKYIFEIQAFRRPPVTKTVVMGDADVSVEVEVQ
jgi:hypothetical protein